MKNMSKEKNNLNKREEKLMDAYFKYIGECHVENIVKELNSKKEEISKINTGSLDTWFQDIQSKTKVLEKQNKRIKILKKLATVAALITVVLITSLSIVTLTVEAVRVRVLNFFMETNEKYTIFRIEEVNEDTRVNIPWDSYYYPSYLPKGYLLENASSYGSTLIIEFSNTEGSQITFSQTPNGTDFNIDTEDSKLSEVMINNYKGFLIEKENKVILFWNDEYNSFSILSNDNFLELINIAKSISKK